MASGTIEPAYALAWLQTTLTNASITSAGASGVWADYVPDGQPLPALVYGLQDAQDTYGAPALRLLTQGLFWVRAVGPSDNFLALANIAGAADALLERASGTAGPTQIYSCYRERPIIMAMLINKDRYSAVGGLYRIFMI